MAVLAATLLANADGRYGQLLGGLIEARRDRRIVAIAFFAVFAALAISSAIGAVLASRMLGLGVLNLFAALALGSAAGALLWRARGAVDVAALAGAPLAVLVVRLLLIQLGDRNQFLIFALGALSGAALWGIAGGAAGLLVAMLPVLALGPGLLAARGARWLRWGAAAALLLWAASHLRGAFGV